MQAKLYSKFVYTVNEAMNSTSQCVHWYAVGTGASNPYNWAISNDLLLVFLFHNECFKF